MVDHGKGRQRSPKPLRWGLDDLQSSFASARASRDRVAGANRLCWLCCRAIDRHLAGATGGRGLCSGPKDTHGPKPHIDSHGIGSIRQGPLQLLCRYLVVTNVDNHSQDTRETVGQKGRSPRGFGRSLNHEGFKIGLGSTHIGLVGYTVSINAIHCPVGQVRRGSSLFGLPSASRSQQTESPTALRLCPKALACLIDGEPYPSQRGSVFPVCERFRSFVCGKPLSNFAFSDASEGVPSSLKVPFYIHVGLVKPEIEIPKVFDRFPEISPAGVKLVTGFSTAQHIPAPRFGTLSS